MMSLQSSMHSSQIKTDGPAISLRTSCWLLPQKEQYSSFSLPICLTYVFSLMDPYYRTLLRGIGSADQYFVHQTVRHRLLRGQEVVPVGILFNGLDFLTAMPGHDLVELVFQKQDFLGVDLDVGCLPLKAADRLVYHHARIRQTETLVLGARGQQQ